MKRRIGLIPMLAIATACGDGTALIVTVDARPQVIGATTLEVTAINDGDAEQRRFDLDGEQFPLTFSITASGRSGDVEIEVIALDDERIARGVGSTLATLESGAATEGDVLLDPADFVVNTQTEASQKPEFRAGRNGHQIAAAEDGSFVVAFLDDCSQTVDDSVDPPVPLCFVYARFFDALGQPVENDVTSDDTEMTVNLDSNQSSSAGVAIGASKMFFAWETFDDVRGLGTSATGTPESVAESVVSGVAPTLEPEDPDVASLADDEFAVVWSQARPGGGVDIRGRFLAPDGTPLTNPTTGDAAEFPISVSAGVTFANPTVASSRDGRALVVAWEGTPDVFVKSFDSLGASSSPGADIPLTALPATATVSGPKAVPLGGGNVAVAWSIHDSADPALERGTVQLGIYDLPAGTLIGSLVTVSPALLASEPAGDPPEIPAPALVVDGNGDIIVAWTECVPEGGDGDGCGVFVRKYDAALAPIGERIQINTTARSQQRDPSIAVAGDALVATFTDSSQLAPDTSGTAVRARLVFFPDE